MTEPNKPDMAQPARPMTFGSALLDRKKMEEERLARLKRRREAAGEDVPTEPARQRARIEPSVQETLANSGTTASSPDLVILGESKRLDTNASPGVGAVPSPSPRPATQPSSTKSISSVKVATPQLPYLQGTIKRTWARGLPRQPDDIRLCELFEKDKLELAVVASFQWDDEWLMQQIDVQRTRLMLIAYAADENMVCVCVCVYSL